MYHNRLELKQAMTKAETADTYNSLRTYFAGEEPVSNTVPMSQILITPTGIEVAGFEMSINERAESVLNERLGIGSIRDMLSEDELESVLPSINKYINAQDGSMILKSRRGQIQGVVSERYREIPYTDTLTIMEHVGAQPIRVFANDYNMKMHAVIPQYKITPKDDASLNLGVQLRTSNMGAGALNFDVFLYRWMCANGCIMGKKAVGSFRTIHVQSLHQAEEDTRRELDRVLSDAAETTEKLINSMLDVKMDAQRVINFLHKQPIGKKALAYIAERLSPTGNMYDAFNVLTEAGHNPAFSQSLQFNFEQAAGELLVLAA